MWQASILCFGVIEAVRLAQDVVERALQFLKEDVVEGSDDNLTCSDV